MPRDALESIRRDILPVLPPELRRAVLAQGPGMLRRVEEIRLRRDRPAILGLDEGEVLLEVAGADGKPSGEPYIFGADDASKTLQLVAGASVYAWEDEFRSGYITLRGGHRVGLAGRAVLEDGRVKTLKEISAFNIRLAREVRGAGDKIIGYCIDRRQNRPLSCLIISPPQCGKTTVLRDMVRQLSDGIGALGIPGMNVGLVDERSEIAASYAGVPQNDVGLRTDVLDACPKAEGIMMLLRSMSPDLIATDEIGRHEDALAILEAINAGVAVWATAHGDSVEEIKRRPTLGQLLEWKAFKRLVFLDRSLGPGTLARVIDGETHKIIVEGPIK